MAVDVVEQWGGGRPKGVDRAAKVLRGVKVLGLSSANTGRGLGLDPDVYGAALDRPYRYALEAVRDAAPLYEGIAVNIDHPPGMEAGSRRRRGASGRSAADRFGRLTQVRVTDEGLTADLEYLASHPLADMIVETAERMPEQLALSHHAQCEFSLEQGEAVVRRIVAVQSVDVIGDRPGTTRSLFESRSEQDSAPPVTMQSLLETVTRPAVNRCLRRLVDSQLVARDQVLAVTGAAEDQAVLQAALRPAVESLAAERDLLRGLRRLAPVLEALGEADDAEDGESGSGNGESPGRSWAAARRKIENAGLPPHAAVITAVAALEHAADQDDLLRVLRSDLARPDLARPHVARPVRSCEPFTDSECGPGRGAGLSFAQQVRGG